MTNSREVTDLRQPQQRLSASTRAGSAVAVVLAAPGLAWLVLIARSGDAASDTQHVLWFLVVGAACFTAGTLVPMRLGVVAALSATAWVAAVLTLYLWWSSVDITGLFMVGIVLAAPPMALAAPVLILAGANLRRLTAS
ncbi:MAG: hypothetical protein Q7T56_12515 [Nocardioidaceae bacterium]|nr:hypothetical protein [Nocardioidaceae bacterium]